MPQRISQMIRRNFLRALTAGTVLAVVAGMAPPAFSAEAPKDAADAWKYLHGLKGQERMAALEREAKREGELVVYGALGIDAFQRWQKLFNDRYPDIKVDFVRLSGRQVPDKVMLEHRTGRMNADAVLSDMSLMNLLNDGLAPYEPTTWSEYGPLYKQGSYQEGWTAAVVYITPTTIAWRTDRVSADEAPKSLDDLANNVEKWKGRVGATDQMERFMAALISQYGEKEAMAKVAKLADLDPKLYKSTAALAQGMGAGEFDVAFNFNYDRPAGLKKKGAPVEFALQDPTHGSGVTISATKMAPHPYAAALFVEFISSKDASEQLDKLEGGVRLFGSKNGNYMLASPKELVPFGPISEEEFKNLNRENERLFIRR